mmetsp:Transcript_22750/g.25904  ORF Transcript_22750/g.25904 Transcript_22750/m.25904 type:complete len:134 (+) Transcript_22750:729-1130(+)
MPAPLRIVISTSKIMVDIIIMSTCFTLAAIHRVRGDVNLLAMSDDMLSVKLQSALKMTIINGRGEADIGSSSDTQRREMSLTSPRKNDNIRHCIIARGAICPSRSTGCNLRLPVNSSPLATALVAANRMQHTV